MAFRKTRITPFASLAFIVSLMSGCQQESQVRTEQTVKADANLESDQASAVDVNPGNTETLKSAGEYSEPVAVEKITFLPDSLCLTDESISFSCEVKSKQLSVCNSNNETVTYRFGKPNAIEMEINSAVHYSRTMYSSGGEGNLAFDRDSYKYVVYSKIVSGERQANGERPLIESGGVYVLENDKLLADVKCTQFNGDKFISNLPPHEEEDFQYYDL